MSLWRKDIENAPEGKIRWYSENGNHFAICIKKSDGLIYPIKWKRSDSGKVLTINAPFTATHWTNVQLWPKFDGESREDS